MQRVCVTGGTGFVGNALVVRLLEKGYSVRVLARPSARADDLENRGAEVVRGNLGDGAAVERAISGSDTVFHAAAMVEAPGDLADFIDANLGGTQRVFEAALKCGVQSVVYTSSIAVYGPAREGEVIDESTAYDSAPQRRDSYAQSKLLADRFAVEFARRTGLPLTILRPGIVFGPGKPLPSGLLAFAIAGTQVVFGRAENRFPLNYIGNLVDAMLLAGDSRERGLRQYLILDDDDLTLGAYHAARVGAQAGRAVFAPGFPVLAAAAIAEPCMRLLRVGRGAGFTTHQVARSLRNRRYSTQRIRRELGWSPRVSLREALRISVQPDRTGAS